MSGAGAAGTAVANLLRTAGATTIQAFDISGAVGDYQGTIHDAMKGADIFIGVSAPNVINEEDVTSMAPGSIVFALANPDPEIDPVIARKYATVVATGRSDQPNQINNVLAFPGIFRGLLDGRITKITDAMLVAASDAISQCVSAEQLNANFIIPSVFDPRVVQDVAAAVRKFG